ncbi:MAG: ABC transporter ATP-binding protein [Thermotogaceae bacterium]|nr:ABC transporter ATP-binding protein [Thermotogaceae bacterium]
MMSSIVLISLEKFFGKNHVIKNLNLEIKHGEFVTLLGPSGCGKTTTLRMIAGFEKPSSGEIKIEDRTVFSSEKKINIPPEERNIGMVFQNYAVWPHMTVFDNVAYPLKIRKLPKGKIKEKVMRMLDIVKLTGLESRYPYQLSGGQQQRVAFARALVFSPSILLLDEPLSNLDAKLREEMRFEVKDLQKRLGITVVYVTHDQSEAMAMSDRVVILKDGIIQQIGTPLEIYENPINEFVADFIGNANFFLISVNNNIAVIEKLEGSQKVAVKNIENGSYKAIVRPEDIILGSGEGKGRILKRAFLGKEIVYTIISGDTTFKVIAPKEQLFDENENVSFNIKKLVVLKK